MIIPEQHQHVFKAVAYMIERKLLDIQRYLIAHQNKMRFVCIEYIHPLSEQKVTEITSGMNRMYDLLEKFCKEYNIPPQQISLQNELALKADFLWEDISGATSKSMRGYGQLDIAIIEDYENKINELTDAVNSLINTCK